MRPGKSDFQEQGFRLRIGAQPPGCQVADEIIRVGVFRKFPFECSEALTVVRSLPVEHTLLLYQAPCSQPLVPLIEIKAGASKKAVLVFHYVAFVETEGRLQGRCVHLADVDAMVSGGVQLFHPGVLPVIAILNDAGCVRIHTRKERRSSRNTGRSRRVTLGEGRALVGQPVQVGRGHIVKTKRPNSVVALLVRNDEDDIGRRWSF